MDESALKTLETKLTTLVDQHKELKERHALAESEIARLQAAVAREGLPTLPAADAGESGDLKAKIDLLLKEREEVRQKVENMIKALEDFEE